MFEFDSKDITETEVKGQSEFLREAIGFVDYEKKEIEGSKKAFMLIAIDPDAGGVESALTLGVVAGQRDALLAAICKNFEQGTPIGEMLKKAASITAMKGLVDSFLKRHSDE